MGTPYYLQRPDEDEEDIVAQLNALGTAPDTAPASVAAPAPARPNYSRAEAFDRARQSDAQTQLGSDLSQNIYNAFTGKPVNDRPKPDAAAAVERRAKLADQDEDNDPTTSASQLARESVKTAMPEVADKLGPHFDRMSKAQIAAQWPFLKELLDARAKRDAAALKPQQAAKNKADLLAVFKAEFPEKAKQFSPEELDALGADALKQYLSVASSDRRASNAQTGADRRAAPGMKLKENTLGARSVFEAIPLDPANPHPLSQEQSTKLADMKAASDTVIEKTREAKSIYGKGGLIIPGSTQDTLIRQLITETYGPMLKTGNIGNLTDSHLHLLKDMLQNPTGDWKSFFNDARFPTMLDALAKGAEENLEHQAHSMGYTFRKGGGHGPEAGGATVTVRRKSDGKTKTIPAASASKYLNDPAYEQVK